MSIEQQPIVSQIHYKANQSIDVISDAFKSWHSIKKNSPEIRKAWFDETAEKIHRLELLISQVKDKMPKEEFFLVLTLYQQAYNLLIDPSELPDNLVRARSFNNLDLNLPLMKLTNLAELE